MTSRAYTLKGKVTVVDHALPGILLTVLLISRVELTFMLFIVLLS